MGKGSTILVVDDDTGLLTMLEVILSHAGYRVVTATDGDQAWETVRLASPEAVLLDWMMPGCDGGTLCRRLKDGGSTRTLPVVMMSCDERLATRATSFGADAFVLKPFDISSLLTCIERVLWPIHPGPTSDSTVICAT